MPAGFETVDTNSRQATFKGRVNSNIPLVGIFMDETQGLSNDVQNTLVILLVWFAFKKSANVLHDLIGEAKLSQYSLNRNVCSD